MKKLNRNKSLDSMSDDLDLDNEIEDSYDDFYNDNQINENIIIDYGNRRGE